MIVIFLGALVFKSIKNLGDSVEEIIKIFYLSKQPVHVLVQTKKKLKEIKNAKEEILKILNQSK